jgi:predicted dehydrogenase
MTRGEENMTRLRLAVVGVGHLGKEHARILSGLPDVELVGVVDANGAQSSQVAQRCQTQAFTSHFSLLDRVDAAVIVVPTLYHHAVAMDFLREGVPVLVEKPMTTTLAEADDLLDLAQRRGVVLQVGHIERFNPAFVELQRRPLVPKFINCERLSGFSGRSTDVGVVLDLMIHDLDLILTLVRSPIHSVDALGVTVLGGHEDVAQARVTFASGCVAQLTASRINQGPARRMQVWGPEGFAGIDFARRQLMLVSPAGHLRQGWLDSRRLDPAMAASLKAELFGRHLQVQEMEMPGVDQLTCELQDFVHCVRTGARPQVDGQAGRDAMAAAEAVLESLRNHRWEGAAEGPIGPSQWPTPVGKLFPTSDQQAA